MSTAYAKFSGLVSGGSGGSGTVTSVALADGSSTPIFDITGSPVTTSGTLTETLKTQAANKIFAGPTTGAAAQPTFRSLVSADLPAIVGPTSRIWVNTPSGHGSTGTTVRTWSNIAENLGGADITYTSSATNGDSFTINTAGVYAITVADCHPSAGTIAGLTLNATGADLSTGINSLAVPKRLICVTTLTQTIGGGIPGSLCFTKQFAQGDVIRLQDAASNPLGITTDLGLFIIQRIS